MALKRIRRELERFETENDPRFTIHPSNEDNFKWEATLEGPPNSKFADQILQLRVDFSSQYPFKPPTVYFTTPDIEHCKVNRSTGRVRVALLREMWSPAIYIIHIFRSICDVLSHEEDVESNTYINHILHACLSFYFIPIELRALIVAYRHTNIALTNETIREAVKLWQTDQQSAILRYGYISEWNTSKVTNMTGLFSDMDKFDEDISQWDVSNVTTMAWMFQRAIAFDSALDQWDVSNVKDMNTMFCKAHSFNHPIAKWNVSKVTTMSYMFSGAHIFNQPLHDWNVNSVSSMCGMFHDTHKFNQPLNQWDVSKVRDMRYMFRESRSFNQPLDSWDVSRVAHMSFMFMFSREFNQPLSNWNVSSVLDMQGMFQTSGNANSFSYLNELQDLWPLLRD